MDKKPSKPELLIHSLLPKDFELNQVMEKDREQRHWLDKVSLDLALSK